ncbi:dihydropyrimidinase [Yoonia sp. 208BN28-4]|uniref:dihydropyrimidinase n=1 Tax=Yoonia sp. 208BN28-4 TaxID=3126505 RepID=UPI0030956029
MVDLVIKGGTVVTPDGVSQADVGITGGKIAALGVLDGAKQIDAAGKIVTPGGVDAHCHIEQMSGMGVWNADTFETATLSAAMGGTTTVVSFAAQAKGERLRDTVANYSARAERGARVDHAFHMTVTDVDVPDFESDLAKLIDAGHRSIKVFTTYNIMLDDTAILRVMRGAKAAGALVCVHAENDAIIATAKADLIAADKTAPHHHAASHPRMAEIEAISRMCHFAEYLHQPVMIFHVSTVEGAQIIRDTRTRGVPVWAETCTHYLGMTEDVLHRDGIDGAKWMCSPPQRAQADQDALWDALADGTLDLVSSDHAPYRFDESGKLSAGPNPPFQDIANGLPGLEVRLPLMFDAMVTRGRGGLEQFVKLTATAPADLYGLTTKGRIAEGYDADLILWTPDKTHTYGANDLHDNVGYNPWEGTTVTGWPETVMLRGEVIVENGTSHAKAGQGRWLKRDRIGTTV